MKFLLLIVPFFVMSQSTERVSVHLFDLPDSISIQEFKQDISQLNALYEKNGYGADRYKISTQLIKEPLSGPNTIYTNYLTLLRVENGIIQKKITIKQTCTNRMSTILFWFRQKGRKCSANPI